MSQGVQVMMVTAPDGKRYMIQNTEANIDKWFIDRKPAVEKPSGRDVVCYSTANLEICLSQH